jgi:hypothetical protein
MWIAVALLVASGGFLMWRAGSLTLSLISPRFFSVPIGRKLSIVLAMVLLSLLHDLFVGPGARMKDPRASTDPPGLTANSIPWLIAIGAVAVTILSVQMRP